MTEAILIHSSQRSGHGDMPSRTGEALPSVGTDRDQRLNLGHRALAGDFATGMRIFSTPSIIGDFATGMRTSSAPSIVGDFATGMRNFPAPMAVGDFATGMRAAPASLSAGHTRAADEDSLPALAA